MMSFNELALYMAVVVGFALSPGPNMMLYLAHTFEHGRRAGWATVAGITSAFLFHVTATVLGLSALLIALPHALDYLRYAGIGYLLYLAWANMKTVEWNRTAGDTTERSLKQFYMKGMIGNLLNPGTVLLYFSVIPQFIHPERKQILLQNLELCGLQMLGSTATNCMIVYFAGFAAVLIKNEKYQHRVKVVMSLLIIVFAVKLLFWER